MNCLTVILKQNAEGLLSEFMPLQISFTFGLRQQMTWAGGLSAPMEGALEKQHTRTPTSSWLE